MIEVKTQKTLMYTDVTNTIRYIGVDDKDIDLFESQYVVPEGISYNSYLILDEKNTLMDTVDARCIDEWVGKLKAELGDKKPDYVVVSHVEPDHAGGIATVVELYPDVTLVGNAKTFQMLQQFFDYSIDGWNKLVVK